MMNTIEKIERAFSEREKPLSLSGAQSIDPEDMQEIRFFQGKQWDELTSEMLESRDALFYHSSGEAFCYYLPGILTCGIKENNPHISIYDSIVSSLDRTPNPDYWDDFFLERWPKLLRAELDAVESWVFWLSDYPDWSAREHSLSRTVDTLSLLQARAGA